jgi:predicted nicotinamide N-methyase
MYYQLSLHKIFNGLQLYIPDPEKVRATYEKLLLKNPATAFPFWAKIWPSAYELASFLIEEPQWIKGKKVLELGAGIGLPSFVVAHLTADIIVSDHDAEAVVLMEKNIDHLQLDHAKAMLLDWNYFPENIKTDVLLLSDINYAAEQFDPLLNLIKHFLEDGTTIILATPQRINITPFAERLQPFIKQSLLRSNQVNEPTEIRILVLSK